MDRTGVPQLDEPKQCPVCSCSTGITPSLRFRRTGWPTWDCPNCDSAFVSAGNLRERIASLYSFDDYLGWTSEMPRWFVQARIEFFGSLLGKVESMQGCAGNLLDVGCSTGQLLEAGLQRGWDVTGIELDPKTAHRTASRLGVNVLAGSGVDRIGDLAQFDLIVMSHCLEHVEHPGEIMKGARKHLKTGGVILLRVPNARSRLAEAGGTNWSWFMPPRHLTYLSERTILKLAETSGLAVHVQWSVSKVMLNGCLSNFSV